MLASYMLSRTLIPTMVHYLLKPEVDMYRSGEHGEGGTAEGHPLIWRIHFAFNRRFERFRAAYTGLLDWALDHRAAVLTVFLIFSLGSLGLVYLVGRDFFPTVDSGQIRLHAQAPAGTRIEKTELIFAEIEKEIRSVIPAGELDTILDNIGVPPGGFNLAFGDSAAIGNNDGDILISLTQDHTPTEITTDRLRKRLHEKFPDMIVLLRSGQYHQPDSELRAAGAHRRAGHRTRRRTELRDCPAIVRADRAHSRRRRRSRSSSGGRAGVAHQCGSHQGRTARPHAARRRQQLADFAQRQQPGGPQLLAQLEERRQLQRSDPDAAIQAGFGGQADANAGFGRGRGGGVQYARLAWRASANQGDGSTGAAPNQSSAAYGNPGALPYQTQLLSNLATIEHSTGPRDRESLQRAAGL